MKEETKEPAVSSPMMKQYYDVKKQYPGCILFFRLGDFFEMFGEDAKKASKILEIALTSRSSGEGRQIKVPMCGVPAHAVDSYISKLVNRGERVVLCDQVEDPKLAKGLVKRDVIRVVTAGTALENNLLSEKTNNYLIALVENSGRIGLALADVSTGAFSVVQFEGEGSFQKLSDELGLLSPRECLIPEKSLNDEDELCQFLRREIPDASIQSLEDWAFEPEEAFMRLTRYFEVPTLDGFGLPKSHAGIPAAGAILYYLSQTHKVALKHIREIKVYSRENYMVLDRSTQENLELVQSRHTGGVDGTLLSVLDQTQTAMGARLLRYWVLHPLTSLAGIRERHGAVAEFSQKQAELTGLTEILQQVHDLERLCGRVGSQIAHARDLLSLKQTLLQVPAVKKVLAGFSAKRLKTLHKEMLPLDELGALLEKSIREDANLSLKEGRLIKPGYSKELDDLLHISKGGKEWIAQLQQKERERTGIGSLKVQFNQVFGYYIEISKSNLDKVPDDYDRKQTLVNAERFITPELKKHEELVLGAEEKIFSLEFDLFVQVRDTVAKSIPELQQVSRALAEVDSLACLARVGLDHSYIQPEMTENGRYFIEQGRHPVLERVVSEGFIPNDTEFNEQTQILLITGPNMAGKSTYLRQTALISLMAQIGSFVPAKSAVLPVVDRVFTRVGASDQLLRGQSTFMVEMIETANILHSATEKSLVILDEIGRGTSTFDGVSIAWAVAEFLHDKIKARTLFATHYYELTELPLTLPRVKNMNVAVKEWREHLIFLRKIVEGSCDRSYGIQVGRLAGLPQDVLGRAKQVLAALEKAHYKEGGKPAWVKGAPSPQISLFESKPSEPSWVEEEVKEIDLNAVTPMEALKKIKEWQDGLK